MDAIYSTLSVRPRRALETLGLTTDAAVREAMSKPGFWLDLGGIRGCGATSIAEIQLAYKQAAPAPATALPTVAGMTLRDYFAAAALQGILAGAKRVVDDEPEVVNTPSLLHNFAAEDAYAYADAMIMEMEMGVDQ